MEKVKKLYNDRMDNLERIIANNNKILSSLMEYQISLESHLQEIIKANNPPTIAIKSASKIAFIPINDIIYCNANLSYTEIVTQNNNKILATKPLNEFEEHFRFYSFYRISKSLLINIRYIHSYDRRTCQILMQNKDILDVARRRRSDFLASILPE